MRAIGVVLIGLCAVAAFLAALAGIVLAVAEMLASRNLEWGPVLLIAHLAAALCAIFWGGPLVVRGKPGHAGWIAGYGAAFALGLVALANMHFKFMM